MVPLSSFLLLDTVQEVVELRFVDPIKSIKEQNLQRLEISHLC